MANSENVTHINYTGIFSSTVWCDKAANGETRVAVLLILLDVIAPGHRHVVDDPETTVG